MDILKNIWTSVRKELPPEISDTDVLVWNYLWKKPMIMKSDLARWSAIAFLSDEELEWGLPGTSFDRIFSHWCLIIPPPMPKRTKKRRRRTK